MVEKRRDLSDPKALRAMAHPVRWKLLDVVKREGTATATQCAREIGESVASCSYHLNILAKYDFVEQAEGGQGREKPWRLVYQGQGWSDVGMEPEAELAAEAASQAFFDYEFGLAKQRLVESSTESDEWRLSLGSHSSDEWLTARELLDLREELQAATQRFLERRQNRDARPVGARPVHLFMTFSVAPQRD